MRSRNSFASITTKSISLKDGANPTIIIQINHVLSLIDFGVLHFYKIIIPKASCNH